MKSTTYTQFARQTFKSLVENKDQLTIDEKNLSLERADIPLTYEEYHSTMILTTVICTILALVLSTVLLFLLPKGLFDILIFAPYVLPLSVFAYYLTYPREQINKRGKDIDRYLPYAVNFLNTMSQTGLNPTSIFRSLSEVNIFGELKTESQKINKEIEVMGIDNISALNHAVNRSPSKKFKGFLQGFIGTLQSGSNIPVYFQEMVNHYMAEDLLERRKNLAFLELIAEMFIMGAIAFPLFMVIILSVMGFTGGGVGNIGISGIIFLLSLGVLPALYAVFYLLINSSMMEEVGKSKNNAKRTISDLYFSNKNGSRLLLSSVILVVVCQIIFTILSLQGIVKMDIYTYMDLAFIYILVITGPYGFYANYLQKQKEEGQYRLPDFFTAVSNSLSAGMTIYRAIRLASKGSYGRLSREIKKMNSEISWHMPVKNVFRSFSDRMKDPVISRSVLTINHAITMGGNTAKIFKAAAKEVTQINDVHQERKANMSMYSMVIIMCFVVFLFIIYILYTTLFSYFFAAPSDPQAAIGLAVTMDTRGFLYSLYAFVFVQGFGSGLLAGYMSDGNLSSGVRYAFLLGLISIIAFKVLFV